ncbi:unnamed protein product [Pleuronectes platessa]|uniref:Uncharacterized protein n=1 Tax=Pleuronectes platessa TaxID=8262 RepID=A0A9N7ULS9_PLEPL|nr:unnamed protein product [Pleuronectes platessa]
MAIRKSSLPPAGPDFTLFKSHQRSEARPDWQCTTLPKRHHKPQNLSPPPPRRNKATTAEVCAQNVQHFGVSIRCQVLRSGPVSVRLGPGRTSGRAVWRV